MSGKPKPPAGTAPQQPAVQLRKIWSKVKEVQIRTRDGEPYLALVTSGGQKVLLPKERLDNASLFKPDSTLIQILESVKTLTQQGSSVWCVFDPSNPGSVSIEVRDQDFTPDAVVFGTT